MNNATRTKMKENVRWNQLCFPPRFAHWLLTRPTKKNEINHIACYLSHSQHTNVLVKDSLRHSYVLYEDYDWTFWLASFSIIFFRKYFTRQNLTSTASFKFCLQIFRPLQDSKFDLTPLATAQHGGMHNIIQPSPPSRGSWLTLTSDTGPEMGGRGYSGEGCNM